ncbi:hypothetical protein [Paractinoplanes lichenicola]|uniref:Uncharacterized protein n=1 Tax=Paractinoplanes lichenicola TaxID=2802976 RepID=A0ABS1VU78_9ACTN|nr:hypothetical protein [Actinoplanes lichenicola]MBL7258018.1 hypothetical protein [Actinoplanes lichenicola]
MRRDLTRRLGDRERAHLRVAARTVLPALVIGVLLVVIGVSGPLAVIIAAVAGGIATTVYAKRRRATTPPPAPLRRTLPTPPRQETPSPPRQEKPTPPRQEKPTAPPQTRKEPAEPTRSLPRNPDAAVEQARSILATGDPGPALALLKDAVTDPAIDPVLALAVVDELVDALSRRAEQSRDDRAYAEGIALLTDLVQRHPRAPEGKSLLHSHRAQYLMFQAARLTARGHAPEATLHDLYRKTEAELREAMAAAVAFGPVWARESAALGMLLCHGPAPDGRDRVDEGIELLRQALDARVTLPGRQRAEIGLDLAAALTLRLRRHDRAEDRAEIHRIVAQATQTDPSARSDADALLAGLETPR